MIIKKAKYKKVKVLQRRMVSREVYGCDCCKKEIKEYPNEEERLDMTVWHQKDDSDTRHYHFCSWDCVLKFVKTVKSDYFLNLPHVNFDYNKKSKKGIHRLVELLKQIKSIQ